MKRGYNLSSHTTSAITSSARYERLNLVPDEHKHGSLFIYKPSCMQINFLTISAGWSRARNIWNFSCALECCWLCMTCSIRLQVTAWCFLLSGQATNDEMFKTIWTKCEQVVRTFSSSLALRILCCTFVLVHIILCSDQTIWKKDWLNFWRWNKCLFVQTQFSLAKALYSMLGPHGAADIIFGITSHWLPLKYYISFCLCVWQYPQYHSIGWYLKGTKQY